MSEPIKEVAMSVLNKKWELVLNSSPRGLLTNIEDDSIFTTDGNEVLGCSEWLRCDKEVLEHIVELHNSGLADAMDRMQKRDE